MSNRLNVPPSPAKLPTEFPDQQVIDKQGNTLPMPTLANARTALHFLNLPFTHNLFTGKKYIGGMALNTDVSGQVTDDAVAMLRAMIREHFGFDPGKNNTWDAVNLFCREHPFHPVKDYLESLPEWDLQPRLVTMLRDYFGAADTPLIRCISELVMVASIRRIYQPGIKFDYMTVLESPEGWAKSSALAALYGAEFFSDQTIIGLDDKHLAETVKGRWCIECADLSGMKKAEVEKVKAQLSRCEDRARPAYGRAVIDTPRSFIPWGTTNENEYLRSQTGNRRFLGVPLIRPADIKAILRDRDQLWAEAMAIEPLYETIMLPEAQWKAAGKEQERRTYKDAWLDVLANTSAEAAAYEEQRTETRASGAPGVEPPAYEYREDHRRGGTMIERVSSYYLMTRLLGIPVAQQNAETGKRLGTAMRKLGWNGPEVFKIGGRSQRGYERDTF